jgi:DNA-binding HxlR family transcriptional regulator
MSVLARPWNGLIIFALEPGPLRFAELAERISTIGDRMLSARLKELVVAGVVARHVDPGPPVRVSYALTEAGRGFRAVSDAVTSWGVTLARAKERPRTRG